MPYHIKTERLYFELPIDSGNIHDSILVDQIRSIDFGSRKLVLLKKQIQF